jgi:hypothetical protein
MAGAPGPPIPRLRVRLFPCCAVQRSRGEPNIGSPHPLACGVAFHAIDYLAHPSSPGSIRNKFRLETREFAIVDLVAHAFKHVTTSGLDPSHAPEAISRPGAAFDQAVFDLSRWDDPIGGVTLDDDRTVGLPAVVVFN